MSEVEEKLPAEEEIAPNQEVVDQTPEKKKKEKSKARKIVEWVLLGIFLVIFGIIGAGQVDAMIHQKEHYNQSLRFGYGSFIVLTGSMEPLYKKQSALITYRESQNELVSKINKVLTSGKGYVDVTFMNIDTGYTLEDSELQTEEFKAINGGQRVTTNQVMTHRIREIHLVDGKYLFVTSGINDQGVASNKGQYQVFTYKQYLGTVKINSPFLGGIFGFISSPWGLLVLLLIPAAYLIVTSSIDIFKTLKETDEGETENAAPKGTALENLSKEERERLKGELLEQMLEERKNKK